MRTFCRLAAAVAIVLFAAVPASGAATVPTWASRYNDCLAVFDGVDLQTATIPQLQAAMQAGRFTSRELTDAYFTRIDAYNEGRVKLDTIRAISGDALAQADAADNARRAGKTGTLLGIPVILKDNIDTVDAPTTAGSIALAGNRPPLDAPLVAELRAAGAVILGKTNMSEFANWMSLGMPSGFSSLGGQVVDPYDQGNPSGSSSGSGAGGTMAFAAGAFGTETSGSILSPSTANSMVGIKPTVGLVSRNGIIPLAHSFDTAGPIARNVTDAAALLSAISAPDATDIVNQRAPGGPPPGHNYLPFLKLGVIKGARIGYSTEDEPTDTAEAAVWNKALAALRAEGAILVETDTLADEGNISLTELGGIPSEFKWGIANYLAHDAGPEGPGGRPALVTDDLTGIIVYNQEHSSEIPYGQNQLIASDATSGATEDDPSSAATILAQRQVIDGMFSAEHLAAYVAPDAAYAGSGAAAGYPSITVPDGYTTATTGTTPHGIQFLGQAWSEPTLIGLGYDFEQSTGDRVPASVHDPAVTESACPAAAQAPLGATVVRLDAAISSDPAGATAAVPALSLADTGSETPYVAAVGLLAIDVGGLLVVWSGRRRRYRLGA